MDYMTCDTMSDTAIDSGVDPTAVPGVTEMAMDCDGDGFAETTLVDFDGDGCVDAMVYDDGFYTEALADLDGDGFMETFVADTDGNGVVDVHIVDQNGDGIAEYEAYGEDPTGTTAVLDPAEGVDPIDGLNPVADIPVDPSQELTTLDSADPFEVTDAVHGDPMAEIEYHQAQPGPVDCLPTSVAMVLSEITGELVPADEVVALANDMGVMTDTGMSAEDGVRLLEEYGINAEVSSGSLDDLRAQLDQGTEVIIGLDSADLYSNGGGPFDVGMEAGHAVVITGIDDDAGVVYINDPGFPDGAGVAIPIETFEDAWADSENLMIEIQPADNVDPEGFLGRLLLPLQFIVGA